LPGCATIGPLPGFLAGVGLTTARAELRSEARGSAARAEPTGPASPRTSTTAPAASHGVNATRRVFLVLAFIDLPTQSVQKASPGRICSGPTLSLD
jgi:hypothetical protein